MAQALLVPGPHPDAVVEPSGPSPRTDVSSLETRGLRGVADRTRRSSCGAVEAFGCEHGPGLWDDRDRWSDHVPAPRRARPGRPEGPPPLRRSDAGGRGGGAGRRPGERHTPCPPGIVGEVWTRSDQNMAGYLNRPEATAATITADGWLRTGDAGFFDADGFLYLTDRLSDVVVSGAENVYPVEVEHVLAAHPAVVDAAVIGVPDERWGETVKGHRRAGARRRSRCGRADRVVPGPARPLQVRRRRSTWPRTSRATRPARCCDASSASPTGKATDARSAEVLPV